MPRKRKQAKNKQRPKQVYKENLLLPSYMNKTAASEVTQFKRKQLSPPPHLPSLASGSFQLQNLRPRASNATSFQSLPASNTPLEELGGRTEYTCSTRICLLMNDLYYTPMSYKEKIPLIVKEMKKVTNSDMANSAFISVFQNIKFYVKEIRNILHSKLKELELVQLDSCGSVSVKKFHPRRYSLDCIYEGEQRNFSNSKGNCVVNDELRAFYGAEEKYIEFLVCLLNIYKGFSEVTSQGPEEICHQLLSLCQPNTEVTDYDVHKSLFYDHIFKDRIILVLFLFNSLDRPRESLQLFSGFGDCEKVS
eukprot:TRINITY_DN1836_c0_g1_i3.p1 TRINITY_DN1836_c0_g1~~TRINITY_DN1836_c0_g1_i3.p1  ORF type:complete len:307 (-),score=63.70 TRINITY_DN1836_c0_g1_i3:176-1096(-)